LPQKKNDIIYTAADIEKYYKGMLSTKERHALEKAALDDPFLADALEGYAISNVDATRDISELQNRLTERTRKEKEEAVPVVAMKKTSFSWWKVAAMIVLIAGAGLVVYQLGLNNKRSDIAQNATPVEKSKQADTAKISSPPLLNADTNKGTASAGPEASKAPVETADSYLPAKKQSAEKSEQSEATAIKKEKPVIAPVLSAAPGDVTQRIEAQKMELEYTTREKNASAARKEQYKAGGYDINRVNADSQLENKLPGKVAGISANSRQRTQNIQPNVFRGRVTDTYHNALPFSNITNTEDGIGTYSDALGYFTLTSPDSVLNVQVRSLGFENNNVQLQNNFPNNPVQLQEDRSSLAEVVISNKKVNSVRNRNNTMVLEEAEPADGWTNYDLYLANNLKLPETFKEKETGTHGEVELSFEVDKNGEPFNISVKKSLCESCDKEAIRLIKEGPKWKRKARKGKATVKVSF
jgi:hypothetical protein